MLEKIGLPARPSQRGSNWVVDASHCQGCSSQFTFINRKHHCRRCGGLFCGNCTQQRMVLRGQGDSPVRICDPCKKIEEAARFEMRYGHKNRGGRGNSNSSSKYDEEDLRRILGRNKKDSLSLGRELGSSSSLDAREAEAPEEGISSRSLEVGEANDEIMACNPEVLRQQALDEKKKYKLLKGEGKSEEALKAFKRGKELERQADALELYLRKRHKKVSSSRNVGEILSKEITEDSLGKSKLSSQVGKEKDDLTAELRELGWSDMDLRKDDKRVTSLSVEGELSNILGEVSQRTGKSKATHNKTEVLAHKKRALMLKREGKLSEAKEELKKAKVLEKQLEEQEMLAEAEDSDDEISALIRSMDSDDQGAISVEYDQDPHFDIERMLRFDDNQVLDDKFEVTDDDMEDPEIAAALKSFGWTEDSSDIQNTILKPIPMDRKALLNEILSLKREALNQKRAGNVSEAMTQLKRAKLLEKDLENMDSQGKNPIVSIHEELEIGAGSADAKIPSDSRPVRRSKITIQKELLGLKKKILTMRREGRLDEADEAVKKCRALKDELEGMDTTSFSRQETVYSKAEGLEFEQPDTSEDYTLGDGEAVTDNDLRDPTYLSLLKNLGWKDEENESSEASAPQSLSTIQKRISKRSKAEMQRELLGLKRKALALRRQGKTEEADEVLKSAQALESQMAEDEELKGVRHVDSIRHKNKPFALDIIEGDEQEVTENDLSDPSLLSMLNNLGWKDDGSEHENADRDSLNHNSLLATVPSVAQSSSGTSLIAPKRKGEIQRELLGLKRKALAHRRNGEHEEAEELLRKAKILEAQMEEGNVLEKDSSLDPPISGKPEKVDDVTGQDRRGNPNERLERSGVLALASMMPNNDDNVKSSGPGFAAHPISWKSEDLIHLTSETTQGNNASTAVPVAMCSSDLLGIGEGTGTAPSRQSTDVMNLLCGDYWNSNMPSKTAEDKTGSDVLSVKSSSIQFETVKNSVSGSKDNTKAEINENQFQADCKLPANVKHSAEGSGQDNLVTLQKEILAHKKTAVALKREGKLKEAKEELKIVKQLEKSLEGKNSHLESAMSEEPSVSTTSVPSPGEKERRLSNSPPKPLSGRDRFKLQQESLNHKRNAMKLRREGRMEEAEAEFELAKTLEAQLESSSSNDSSVAGAVAADVAVEDFLDPQLRSALRAIGLDDSSTVSQGTDKSEPKDVGNVSESRSLSQQRIQLEQIKADKSQSSSQQRIHLEEQIKAEKMKALNLKRSGKQAEALDALRRAKVFEKKLSSLP